jgi:hypothetical protein
MKDLLKWKFSKELKENTLLLTLGVQLELLLADTLLGTLVKYAPQIALLLEELPPVDTLLDIADKDSWEV